jgi:NADH-quinone oxidoreductase subunit H
VTAASWENAWRTSIGLPEGVPAWVVAAIALSIVFVGVVLPATGFVTYLERKLGADLQARVGPNRAGPAGMFQPIADLLKLLQKDDRSDRGRGENAWLLVHTMALYSTLAVLPLGSSLVMVDTDMSVFLPFWAMLVLSVGTLMLGLGTATVPGWLGGLRVAAQALAAAFPSLITLCTAGLSAGSFRWSRIVEAQAELPLKLAALSSPFEALAFVVFLVGGLVLLGVPPFDGGQSVPDLHGGVGARVGGRRLSLLRLGRFYGFFVWSVMATTLFLGGWSLPEGIAHAMKDAGAERMLVTAEASILLLKTVILMILVGLVGAVSPRLRADQITDLTWKVLGPLALLALAGTAVWMEVMKAL